MGQYFLIVNLDKKEYLHPHCLGGGLKLWEIAANDTLNPLALLLRQSSDSGGGDLNSDEYFFAGHWAGDRITIVGDYDKSKLYDLAQKNYENISHEVIEEFNKFINYPEKEINPQAFGGNHSCIKYRRNAYIAEQCQWRNNLSTTKKERKYYQDKIDKAIKSTAKDFGPTEEVIEK